MIRRVLIVDDSLTVRMDLGEAFEAVGYAPILCASAAQGRRAAREREFHLVILDVRLPDGDGIELMGELRQAPETADVPIILLSSEAEVRDRVRGLAKGADEYVGKPYDPTYLIARADELLRKRAPSPLPASSDHILVIDDSLTFREELREALIDAGYEVTVAATGEDGLRAAAQVCPTAIVVDGVLPGMDGPAVIRRVRLDATLRAVPCILVTGAETRGAELRALDAGADTFIRKGEELPVILAKIEAAVRRGGPVTALESALSAHGPKKLLAVDDSPTFLQTLAASLRGSGHDVILARSGEEALDLLGVQLVDCVLLDLLMPGLGGLETCRRIKAAPMVRDIPIIMLTAVENRDTMVEGLRAGADDFLAKSSDHQVLEARIRAQIRRRQFEDEQRRMREALLRTEMDASEARAAREVAEARAALVEELSRKNKELEAFSYSVSHDLRAPLRGIEGFSRALMVEHGANLEPKARHYVTRVISAAERMDQLIDAMLELSRVSRAEVRRERVDLSDLALQITGDLQRREPARLITVRIEPDLFVDGDATLLRIVLENLLGNAWKFTAKALAPRVEVGAEARGGSTAYYVRDNGAGFDMRYADKLFGAFQRLHSVADFPGTGIGLANVRRVIDRHGGRVWATAVPGKGATIHFTVPPRLLSAVSD